MTPPELTLHTTSPKGKNQITGLVKVLKDMEKLVENGDIVKHKSAS